MSPIALDKFDTHVRSDGVTHYTIPDPRCERCDIPIDPSYARFGTCRLCAFSTPWNSTVLERIVATTLYVSDAPGLPNEPEIGALKQAGAYAVGYAEMMEKRLREVGCNPKNLDVIIPVPSARDAVNFEIVPPSRSILKGPYALARALGERLSVPWADELWFTRQVETQKGKTREERWINVSNSMATRSDSISGNVLIVDDVCTSCAIVFEASRAVAAVGGVASIAACAARDIGIDWLPIHLKTRT